MSKTLASALVGLTVAFLGVVIVGYLATSQWMTPFRPIRLVTLGVLLPVVVFGLLITMPGEGEDWTPMRVISGAGPGTLFGIIGMIVVASWATPSTRISAVEMFDQDKSRLVLALADRDANVSAAACAALLKVGPGGFRGQLLDEARIRPDMAALCMTGSEAMERGPEFASRLMGKWENDLLLGKAMPGETCELPDAVAGMPIDEADRERALLVCFFRSQSSEMRRCCADNLGALIGTGEAFTERLSTQSELLVKSGLLEDVTAVSFGTAHMDEDQKSNATKLGLGAESSERRIFDMVCEGVAQMEQPSDVTKHLAASLDGRCTMDTTAIPRGRGAWAVICDETQVILDANPDFSVVEALCLGVEGMSTARAVAAASSLLGGAIEGKRKFGTMGAAIFKGVAMQGDSAENARKLEIETFIGDIRNDPNLPLEGRKLMEGIDSDTMGGMAGQPFEEIQKVIGGNPSAMGATDAQKEGLSKAREHLKNAQGQ